MSNYEFIVGLIIAVLKSLFSESMVFITDAYNLCWRKKVEYNTNKRNAICIFHFEYW